MSEQIPVIRKKRDGIDTCTGIAKGIIKKGVNNEEQFDEYRKHRRRFEQSMKDTLKTAKSYYETNRMINLIVVGAGVAFLASAIAHTWTPGAHTNNDAWLSLGSGGKCSNVCHFVLY
jgi:hypothetical protein